MFLGTYRAVERGSATVSNIFCSMVKILRKLKKNGPLQIIPNLPCETHQTAFCQFS